MQPPMPPGSPNSTGAASNLHPRDRRSRHPRRARHLRGHRAAVRLGPTSASASSTSRVRAPPTSRASARSASLPACSRCTRRPATTTSTCGPRRSGRSAPRGRGRGPGLRGGGARLAFGSDWPVVTIDPWQGLRMLRTRQTLQGTPPGGWLPDERLTLEQAIEGYTDRRRLRRPARGHRGVARTRQGRRSDRAVAGHHHGRARRDRQDHRRPDRGRRQSGARCR